MNKIRVKQITIILNFSKKTVFFNASIEKYIAFNMYINPERFVIKIISFNESFGKNDGKK